MIVRVGDIKLSQEEELILKKHPKFENPSTRILQEDIHTILQEDPRKTPASPTTPPNPKDTPSPPPTKKRKLRAVTKKTNSSKKTAPSWLKKKISPAKRNPETPGWQKKTPPGKKTPTYFAKISQTTSEDKEDLTMPRIIIPGCSRTIQENQPGVKTIQEHQHGVKRFTIGHARDDVVDSVSKVKALKMDIEKKIRQGKRWSVVEDTRRRIITPAKAKRTRGDDGEWETHSNITEMEQHSAMMAGQRTQSLSQALVEDTGRKIQTPINSFLVFQTLEDRALQLRRPANTIPAGAELGSVKEMSALSPASPILRKRISKKTGTKDVKKDMEDGQKMPRKVNTIVAFLQKAEEKEQKPLCSIQPSNNNRPCDKAGPVSSTSYGQRRASYQEESHSPIESQADDHVTRKSAQGPISSQNENQHEEQRKSSHFEGEKGPE